jgi:hypothetical protein
MAVTVTPQTAISGPNSAIFDIEATADGDTGATINHGLAELPWRNNVQGLGSTAGIAAAARLSAWLLSGVSTTQVTVVKTTAGGSGIAGLQARVSVERPHTIVR